MKYTLLYFEEKLYVFIQKRCIAGLVSFRMYVRYVDWAHVNDALQFG